jgi:eukaryotic-like serine/threonine-protein kinase
VTQGPPVASLEPGDPDHIGSFRLLGRIGAGGMGVVYLAEGNDGRRVAVKMIRSELTQDPVVRQRFLREVRAARQVHSPVTAAVLDADAEANPPWVAFEYVDSPNLEEVVEEQVPRLSAAVGILSGIAEALMAIHQAGIIHRDLKPSNILCPANGVKVIDFGIAAAKESTMLTVTGLIGTPAWLSPEQILGHPLTPAVDVFAWGCIAVYTLTGRQPFGGGPDDVPAALFYRIVNDAVDLSGVPPQLMATVSAALSKDPARRPAVAALLDMLLPGRSPAAPPPGAPTVTAPPPPTMAPDPVPTPTRTKWPIYVVLVLVALAGGVVALTRGGGGTSTTTTLPPTPATTTANTTANTTATTAAPGTAPAMPTSLAGFTKNGGVVDSMVRVFQGEGASLVPDFPWTMNGCAQQTFTVQWRAEGAGAVTAGMTQDEQPPVPLSDVPQPTTAVAGLMRGDGCSQPAFFFVNDPPDTLEDVAVAYQVWSATP